MILQVEQGEISLARTAYWQKIQLAVEFTWNLRHFSITVSATRIEGDNEGIIESQLTALQTFYLTSDLQ